MLYAMVTTLGSFPCLVRGEGPPLVFLAGLLPKTGVASWQNMHAASAAPYSARRRVYYLNRRADLPAGITFAQLAAEHAQALRCSFDGSVDLLGLISVSVELYLSLTYTNERSEIAGQASLTLGIHVLFINKSVTLSTEKRFKVPGGGSSASAVSPRATPALETAGPADPPGPGTPGPTSFGDLITSADWDLYLGAFA